MVTSAFSCLRHGLEGRLVEVQVDISAGLPAFHLVGLAATSVKEARERVRSAIRNSELPFPARRLTVNLAPAELRKEGSELDLAIAVGIVLAGIGQAAPTRAGFIGELALDGAVRHVDGVLVAARLLAGLGFERVYVARADAAEAALVAGLAVHPCDTLGQLAAHLLLDAEMETVQAAVCSAPPDPEPADEDLGEVQGQEAARRALEIAAAGGHHLLMSGPPGAGKTMLARCLPGLLPPLSFEEALEVSQVRSILGELEAGRPLEWRRPFRDPHHGISPAGLVGGGAGVAGPGEVTRAHHGVLFLDELAEFSPASLQSLRQPLESGHVKITRSGGSVAYPARFQLVAATNPCPCGWLGDPEHACRCSEGSLSGYRRALSGPLLDRIDLRVTVSRPRLELLGAAPAGEASAAVRGRVVAARRRQLERQGKLNASLRPLELRRHAPLTASARTSLQRWAGRQALTARGFHRAWRVALTAADLEGEAELRENHVLEALGYRLRDEVA